VAIARGRVRARRPTCQCVQLSQSGRGGNARRKTSERKRIQGRVGQALFDSRAGNGGKKL